MLMMLKVFNLRLRGSTFMEDTIVYVREIRDIFKKYGITLLTGEAGLDNGVSSVNVLELDMEHQNPAWYLGGELVLSTFWMFDSAESIIDAVRLLADRAVAALCIHQGFAPSKPDEKIVEAAREVGLPLFSIPHDMPYSIIFTWVYERIFSKRATTILESEKINTTLTQALFVRDSVEAISQTLSGILQKTTAVLDENNNVLASTATDTDGELFVSLLQDGALEKEFAGNPDILLPEQLRRISLTEKLDHYEAVIQQAVSEGKLVGNVVILAEKSQNPHSFQMDKLGLMHSATALTIVQMKRKAVLEAEERLRGDLYSDLLSEAVESIEYIAVRANKLDIPLHGIHCVLEIIPSSEFRYQSEEARTHFRERLKGVVVSVCGPNNVKSAVLPQTEGILVILHFPPMTKPAAQEKQIQDIYTAILDQLSGNSSELYVGVGETPDSLMDLSKSCRQANRAINLGKKITGSGGLFFYGKLGVYSLLDVKNMDELRTNCIQELARIETALAGNEGVYLDTLEAYFACGESPTAMAKSLGIHVNTAKYRIKKIKEALGENLFLNGDEKMRIYLLLKMRRLMR